MLDIREKDARAQGNIKSQNEKEEAAHNATLKASLKEAEKAVEFERAEALRLQTEVKVSFATCYFPNIYNSSSLVKGSSVFKTADRGQ